MDELEFTWDNREDNFVKESEKKYNALLPLDQYIDFLEQIGSLKSDRTLSKIYPERFSL